MGVEVVSILCVLFEGKWIGGIIGMFLDCLVEVVWEFVLDWVNWYGWFFGNFKFELCEGENRKLGCL